MSRKKDVYVCNKMWSLNTIRLNINVIIVTRGTVAVKTVTDKQSNNYSFPNVLVLWEDRLTYKSNVTAHSLHLNIALFRIHPTVFCQWVVLQKQ